MKGILVFLIFTVILLTIAYKAWTVCEGKGVKLERVEENGMVVNGPQYYYPGMGNMYS